MQHALWEPGAARGRLSGPLSAAPVAHPRSPPVGEAEAAALLVPIVVGRLEVVVVGRGLLLVLFFRLFSATQEWLSRSLSTKFPF